MATQLLGVDAMAAWNDPKTTDFYLYATGSKSGVQRIGVRNGGRLHTVSEITSVDARSAFNLISSYAGVTVNEQYADAETTLLDETRVQFMHPPVTLAPKMTWRKSIIKEATFEALGETSAYNAEKIAFLRYCVDERLTVCFVGATGHGKTTGGKAYMHDQKRYQDRRRFIIIQDRNEVRPPLETVEYYFVTKARLDHPGYSGAYLLKLALSDDPDILVYGELRDAETCGQHKQAMNTGHGGGFASYHANEINDGYHRYGDWVEESGMTRLNPQLARLLPVMVYCYIDERSNEFRTKVGHTTGFEQGESKYELIGE